MNRDQNWLTGEDVSNHPRRLSPSEKRSKPNLDSRSSSAVRISFCFLELRGSRRSRLLPSPFIWTLSGSFQIGKFKTERENVSVRERERERGVSKPFCEVVNLKVRARGTEVWDLGVFFPRFVSLILGFDYTNAPLLLVFFLFFFFFFIFYNHTPQKFGEITLRPSLK